ncbi:hypothetical protein KAU19_06860 [Candidatus Parcubacteria bacterium]|nr:hypothetical protein [Candidatus Parcubacteria bacterium]
MKKTVCCIGCIVGLIMTLAAVNLAAAADEKIIKVSNEEWETTFYEILIDNNGNAWFQTRLKEYIDKNGGSIYAGEEEARRYLEHRLAELRKNSGKHVIKEGYKITFLDRPSEWIFYHSGYAITLIGHTSPILE